MFRNRALVFNSIKRAARLQTHFVFCFVLHWLHPSGVAIDVVEEHFILVAAAGVLRGLASLVCVDRGFRLLDRYKDVVLL